MQECLFPHCCMAKRSWTPRRCHAKSSKAFHISIANNVEFTLTRQNYTEIRRGARTTLMETQLLRRHLRLLGHATRMPTRSLPCHMLYGEIRTSVRSVAGQKLMSVIAVAVLDLLYMQVFPVKYWLVYLLVGMQSDGYVYRQLAAGLHNAFLRWSSCPRGATANHSVAVDRTPNLPNGRRTQPLS